MDEKRRKEKHKNQEDIEKWGMKRKKKTVTWRWRRSGRIKRSRGKEVNEKERKL